jgi:hypothetical protein
MRMIPKEMAVSLEFLSNGNIRILAIRTIWCLRVAVDSKGNSLADPRPRAALVPAPLFMSFTGRAAEGSRPLQQAAIAG